MYSDKKRNHTGVRLVVASILVGVALAGQIVDPAEAVAPPPAGPLAPHLLSDLAEPPALDWDSIQPVQEWVAEREAAKALAEQKKRAALAAKRRAASQPTEKRIPSKRALSEAQMRELISNACDKYGIDGADRKWLVAAWLKVTWSESRWVPTAQNPNSTASGLAQFLAAWGPLEDRLDPVWTANRFARVFRDGGKAKIRQHWRATIGGL